VGGRDSEKKAVTKSGSEPTTQGVVPSRNKKKQGGKAVWVAERGRRAHTADCREAKQATRPDRQVRLA